MYSDFLKNKTAIVTGAGQGIGKATALTLLENDMKVVIAEKDREAGTETASELSSLGPVTFVETDVSREESVQKMVAAALEKFGSIYALVNNAGFGISRPLPETTLQDWNSVLGTSLTGAFLCSKYCAENLASQKGVIVNIASTRAFMSEPETLPYSAAKGGLVSLTHSLAMTLSHQVRVNCISPGWISVEEWKKKAHRKEPSLTRQDHQQHPAGRVGTPQDVASMVRFLLSDESGFITGQNFIVDGGMTRKMIYVE